MNSGTRGEGYVTAATPCENERNITPHQQAKIYILNLINQGHSSMVQGTAVGLGRGD